VSEAVRLWRAAGGPRLFAVTSRVGSVPPTSILVIMDTYEGTQASIAVLSGLVAGTLPPDPAHPPLA
jgi:hypothetical protein